MESGLEVVRRGFNYKSLKGLYFYWVLLSEGFIHEPLSLYHGPLKRVVVGVGVLDTPCSLAGEMSILLIRSVFVQ